MCGNAAWVRHQQLNDTCWSVCHLYIHGCRPKQEPLARSLKRKLPVFILLFFLHQHQETTTIPAMTSCSASWVRFYDDRRDRISLDVRSDLCLHLCFVYFSCRSHDSIHLPGFLRCERSFRLLLNVYIDHLRSKCRLSQRLFQVCQRLRP